VDLTDLTKPGMRFYSGENKFDKSKSSYKSASCYLGKFWLEGTTSVPITFKEFLLYYHKSIYPKCSWRAQELAKAEANEPLQKDGTLPATTSLP
jgi:hypothetical protein